MAAIRVMYIFLIFIMATFYLYSLTQLAPANENTEKALKFPSSLDDLRSLADLLKSYHADNYGYVLLLFCSAYIYKQMFAIPGSAFLNVLAGAIFGMPLGYPLCCLLTGIGASCCYLLSKNFGADLLKKLFASKVDYMNVKVQENSDRLIFFLLFLRLFPMTPNWLINMMSPIVGIPLDLFFVTVILGLMPYNYLCVQAGEMLTKLNSMDELFTWQTGLKMGLMAVAALGPGFYKKRAKRD